MNRTVGIDVSRWQGDFAFGRAAAEGAKFAVLRGAYTAPALGGGKDGDLRPMSGLRRPILYQAGNIFPVFLRVVADRDP